MDNVIERTLYKGKIKVRFLGPTDDKPYRHIYYVDGIRKTGATTIINIKDKSGALIPWALEEAAKHLFQYVGKKLTKENIIKAVFASEEVKAKSADVGSKIHDWIERFIKYKLEPKKYPMPEMPDDKNVARGVMSFMQWHENYKVKFLWAEKVVYSKKHDYIGKADFAAVVDGKKCLCDIKTGNGLYNSVMMQTAAYQKADEEESGFKYDGRWAIRIAKETEEEYLERMRIKVENKTLLNKKTYEVKPYQVFEAVFLDDEDGKINKDFKAFLAAIELFRWDQSNSMY